jgi:hypothetical protein
MTIYMNNNKRKINYYDFINIEAKKYKPIDKSKLLEILILPCRTEYFLYTK